MIETAHLFAVTMISAVVGIVLTDCTIRLIHALKEMLK